jgi:TPP-dependent pyruvate/acetoin dehydrogenase alpha subunit
LIRDGVLTEAAASAIEAAATAEIAGAVEAAQAAPYPEAAEAYDHVFAQGVA